MSRYQLKYLPIDEMKVSKLNMRHGRKAPNINDIYPSVLKSGVLKSMLVRREGDKWGVVAGRRRLFALRRKQKETGKAQSAPCAIMKPDDDAAAMEATIIENAGVEPVSDMQQYEAFGRIAKQGRSVGEIADYFGVDERDVKRVLALANLTVGVRKLYGRQEIDASTIRALTLATKAQQKEWLRLYEDGDAPMGRRARAWIAGGAAITTDKALFDLASYDGAVANDLFGDFGVFTSAERFWEAQSRAVATRIGAYREKGWRDVTVLERGAFFHVWDHEKRARTKGGRVFVEIRHDGTVTFHEGYVTRAEARKLAKEKAGGGGAGDEKTIRPEMSAPVAEYVALHRHAAARAELVANPRVALRLMIAHAIAGSALWQVRAHQCRTKNEPTRESVESGAAAAQLEEARVAVAVLFGEHGVRFEGLDQNGDDWRLSEIFAALLKMDESQILAVAAVVMAESLEAGSASVEAALHVADATLDAWWTPDEAFFDLLRDKRAINALVRDIAGDETAKTVLTDTAKAQKSLIRERLAKREADAGTWLPAWMRTPPRRLVDGAASSPADQWTRIAGLFEAGGKDEAQDAA